MPGTNCPYLGFMALASNLIAAFRTLKKRKKCPEHTILLGENKPAKCKVKEDTN